MNYTLIVYEFIPEEARLYLVPNTEINDRQRQLLESAHGVFEAGDTVNAGTRFVANALAEHPDECSRGCPPADRCIWARYEAPIDEGPIKADITCVICTGTFL